jgi:hypothetical protein
MTFEFEVGRRTDLDKTRPLPGTEAAGEDDDKIVVMETVFTDKAADRLLQEEPGPSSIGI